MITTTFLIWLYLARNHAFYYVRNMFMIAMGLALVGYLVYPTAPPRCCPSGASRTRVAEAVGPADGEHRNVLYNPYAAVPSMHVAFALMIAIPAMKLVANTVRCKLRSGRSTRRSSRSSSWSPPTTSGSTRRSAPRSRPSSAYAAHAALGRARPEAWAWRTAEPAKATA